MKKLNKMLLFVIIGVLIQAVFVRPAGADEVVFINGDRLTGKIIRLVDKKLVFQSDVAGEVTVDVSKIQTFSSEEPVEIHLNDGTILKQKVNQAEPNRFSIEGNETIKAQELDISAVSSINPPPKPEPKWTGNITAGITSTHGNTKTDQRNASLNLSRRTEKDRITLNADYARGKQEDPDTGKEEKTEDWWRTKAKYDYFFTKKLYGYIDNRYEKDSIAELDRRIVFGGGAGYQWIESEDMNFSTEAGLASLYEKYDNTGDSNSELSAQLGYHFDKKLYKKIKFLNDLVYYPSLEEFSDYYMSTTAEVRAYFTERFFANFKAILDYDATPAPGSGDTDVKYIFGLGLNF
jgi:putative salt-induced outer membrane protein YdiY